MNPRNLEFNEEFGFRESLFLTYTIKLARCLIRGYYSNSGMFDLFSFVFLTEWLFLHRMYPLAEAG